MIKRGQYTIIRANGTEQVVEEAPTLSSVHEALKCDCIDALRLSTYSINQAVMLVDDSGMLKRLPVNVKATALYRAVVDTPYSIHGDVIVCSDMDFGDDED